MNQKNETLLSKINFDDTSVAFAPMSDKKLSKTLAIFWLMNQNWMVKIGTFSIKLALNLHLPIKSLLKNTIFEHFCGGESITDCKNTIEKLSKFGVGTILDYSVEGEDNEEDFDATAEEVIRTIEMAAQEPDKIPFAVFKVTGLGLFEILQKRSHDKTSLSDEEKIAFERTKKRVESISAKAFELNVGLFFDAEESWVQATIDELCYEMMEHYNKGEKVIIYNTYQFYLKESINNLFAITKSAREKGFKIGAKLVRGAYMEKERKRAEDLGYTDPIQPTKVATDNDYDLAVTFALDNLDIFAFCLGTHNEASSKACVSQMMERGIEPNDSRIHFAQLLGMSDNISYNVAEAGFNAAKYVPYGPLESVMPYLIRRAEENTSVAGQSSREFLLINKEYKRRKSS